MKKQNDIILYLSEKIIESMKKCVKNAYPNEAFGLVFGYLQVKKDELDPEEFIYHYYTMHFKCLESDKKSPVTFLIDNVEKLNAALVESIDFIERGSELNEKFRIISLFHSHPAGAFPSGVDERNMIFLNQCGLKQFKNQIWTIMDASNYELNGFICLRNEFFQIKVKILE